MMQSFLIGLAELGPLQAAGTAVHHSMNASAGVNPSPCASATGLQVILPPQTLRPLRKWMSSLRALRQPLSASCKMTGRVALLSANVDVRATAPGILATQ